MTMAKRNRDGKLPKGRNELSAYALSGFPTEECIRAEAKVSQILREKLGETRAKARQVLEALLPTFKRRGVIDIDENVVRTGVRKVLESEE